MSQQQKQTMIFGFAASYLCNIMPRKFLAFFAIAGMLG